MQDNYEIFKDLIPTVGLLVLLFVLEILKKKSSENEQLTGHFQSSFFLSKSEKEKSFFFFLNLKKNPVNQQINFFCIPPLPMKTDYSILNSVVCPL